MAGKKGVAAAVPGPEKRKGDRGELVLVERANLERLILTARNLCLRIEETTIDMPLEDPGALIQYIDEWIAREQSEAVENTATLRYATRMLGRPLDIKSKLEGVEDEGEKKEVKEVPD